MSLLRRKKRPLARDAASLRDDRQFFVACDDTYAPEQYFGFFRLSRVHIQVVPSVGGRCAAGDVLKRLLEYSRQFGPEEDDELWMLLDTDHYTKASHVRSFVATIKRAQKKNINIALSKPCFELWLLLHHENESVVGSLSNASDVARALRAKLGQYDKTKLKQKDYPLNTVPDAVKRAEKLDESVTGGDIPQENTSRVYLLWKAIVSKALPSQLPSELRNLLD